MSAPEPTMEKIRPRTRVLGRLVRHRASVDSTMRWARQALDAGDPDGTVLVADEQTAGLGRIGRAWHSPVGNLHASVLLCSIRPMDATWVPLLAGAALAEACGRLLQLNVQTKWPNDVLVGGRKVAGILTEAVWAADSELTAVVVGVGANANLRLDALPHDIRAGATSLSHEAGRRVCLPALLKVFLERFEAAAELLDAPFELRRAFVESSMITVGAQVTATVDGAAVHGQARGVGPRGELIIDTTAGEVRVDAGQVEHLRPRGASPLAKQL